MQGNCLAAEQVEVIASVLRRHAVKNVAEYIRSARGNGTLSWETLTARLELLADVAQKASDLAPAFADRFKEIDTSRYLELARAGARKAAAA